MSAFHVSNFQVFPPKCEVVLFNKFWNCTLADAQSSQITWKSWSDAFLIISFFLPFLFTENILPSSIKASHLGGKSWTPETQTFDITWKHVLARAFTGTKMQSTVHMIAVILGVRWDGGRFQVNNYNPRQKYLGRLYKYIRLLCV